MNVTSVTQVLGWIGNSRVTEVRNTYHYDKGNNVTTVITRSQEFALIGYDRNGVPVNDDRRGQNININV